MHLSACLSTPFSVCVFLSLFVCLCLQLWWCICVGVCLQSASCCSTALLTVSSSVEQVCLKRLTPQISSNHNNLPSGISINHITLVGCCLASWHSALQKQGNVKITIIASALCDIKVVFLLVQTWVCGLMPTLSWATIVLKIIKSLWETFGLAVLSLGLSYISKIIIRPSSTFTYEDSRTVRCSHLHSKASFVATGILTENVLTHDCKWQKASPRVNSCPLSPFSKCQTQMSTHIFDFTVDYVYHRKLGTNH